MSSQCLVIVSGAMMLLPRLPFGFAHDLAFAALGLCLSVPVSVLSLFVSVSLCFTPSLFVVGSAVVEARASYEASEASLGEVPDEFLDPVLCHVMKDPVLLPTSGTILDRCGRFKADAMRRDLVGLSGMGGDGMGSRQCAAFVL